MQYSEEFKKEAIDIVFENSAYMKLYLENGDNEIIGETLEAFSKSFITAEEIIAELEKGNTEALLKQARKIIVAKKLYKEWLDFYSPEEEIKETPNNVIDLNMARMAMAGRKSHR